MRSSKTALGYVATLVGVVCMYAAGGLAFEWADLKGASQVIAVGLTASSGVVATTVGFRLLRDPQSS